MIHFNEKPASNDEILRLYNEGVSPTKIGERVGLHRVSVGIRLRKLGVDTFPRARARINTNGYEQIFRPGHPMANSSGHVLVHRLVMAESLGRNLTTKETVHHIDGDKLNNELSNLQLRVGRHGKHGCYECSDCGSRNIRGIPI